MRIGMMADLYMTTVSGVTNSLTLSKRWLEKMGHEVYIFTFGDDDVIDNEKNIIRTSGLPVVDTGFYLNLHYNKIARQLLYTMDIAHVHHPFRQWVTGDALLCSTKHTNCLLPTIPATT
jgi:hypothetical protein